MCIKEEDEVGERGGERELGVEGRPGGRVGVEDDDQEGGEVIWGVRISRVGDGAAVRCIPWGPGPECADASMPSIVLW